MKKHLCFLVVLASLIAWSLPGQAQERTLKFAYQNQKGHPQDLGAQKFADAVQAKSGGKIVVKLFPGGQLGGDLQTVSALQGGTIELTVLNAGILSAQAKEFAIFDFPFLFADAKEADAVVDGPFGKKLFAKLEDKGIVGLGWFDLGFRNITNSRRPINKVDDIEGLKIRVIQSPIYIDMFNAIGANATPMPFPEVYQALEQRVIDGQENPFTVIRGSKFQEVQKFLAITNHTYNPQALIISRKTWDAMRADEKKIVLEAAAEAERYQRQVSRAQADEALADLKKAGMQVTEFSPAELQRFRDKVKPVIEKHGAVVGQDTIKELYGELAKIRK